MGSGIFYPAVSDDDGYTYGLNFDLNGNHLVFGNAGGVFNLFVRFVNVVIPQDSLITAAYMRFIAKTNCNAENLRTNIYFNDVDDASSPINYSGYTSLVKTFAFAPWDDIEPWSSGDTYDTPSLVDELQEIVNRDGFSGGNAVIALILDNGSPANVGYRNIQAFDYDGGSKKPELHVEWSAKAGVRTATWDPEDKGNNITLSTNLLIATHA